MRASSIRVGIFQSNMFVVLNAYQVPNLTLGGGEHGANYNSS